MMAGQVMAGNTSKNALIIHECEKLVDEVCRRYKTIVIDGRKRTIMLDDHPREVSHLALSLGERAGMTDQRLRELAVAAPLHDAGKAHEEVSPGHVWFLRKKYDDYPNVDLRKLFTAAHTKYGPEMIKLIEKVDGFAGLPVNRPLMDLLCLQHHPEIDPECLNRCLEVRIVAIADLYEALVSDSIQRQHRERPWTEQEAAVQLWKQARKGLLDLSLTELFITSRGLKVVDFQ